MELDARCAGKIIGIQKKATFKHTHFCQPAVSAGLSE
jgi:hypothetical protein